MEPTLAEIVADAAGVAAGAVRLEPRAALAHQSNRLVEAWAGGCHLVVKEYLKPDEWEVAPTREFRALQMLLPLDVAPRPVLLQPAAPGRGPLVIYEWLEGEMWDRRRPTADELARLADLWLATHTVSTGCDWLSRGSERPLDQAAAEGAAVLAAYAAWVEAAFPAGRHAAALCIDALRRRRDVIDDLATRAPVPRFCRSDQRFANVIARPDGRLGLVDWEDSGLRDPARDVADLLAHANQEDLLTWAEWQPFLTPYLAAQRRADPDLEGRARLYMALFPLYWLAVLLGRGMRHVREGTLRGWTINGLPPDGRLRRYLARALVWPEMDPSGELERLGEVAFFPR